MEINGRNFLFTKTKNDKLESFVLSLPLSLSHTHAHTNTHAHKRVHTLFSKGTWVSCKQNLNTMMRQIHGAGVEWQTTRS